MSVQAAGRYKVPVDVHLIVLRDSPGSRQVLLSRRAGEVYEAALDAVSGIQCGHTHHDPEVVERGLRTLRALRTGTFI